MVNGVVGGDCMSHDLKFRGIKILDLRKNLSKSKIGTSLVISTWPYFSSPKLKDRCYFQWKLSTLSTKMFQPFSMQDRRAVQEIPRLFLFHSVCVFC